MERTVSQGIYRFGPFELLVEATELRKNGVRLKLQDQPFHILCTLLEHPGELVTREQLRQQLWPEGTFVDFEHGLNTAIKKIRDVLSDDSDTPRYIETIPRKGYRFLAPLNQNITQTVKEALPSPRPRWRLRTPTLIVVAVVLIVVAIFILRRVSYPPYLRISATRQLTFTGDVAPNSTIETDGRRVYYFKWYDSHLYSVPVGGGAESSYATRFVQPVILHISPDGSILLVKENTRPNLGIADRIWLLPTNGGPARPLGDIEADFAAWSPDGKAIAFSRKRAIYLTEDEGTSYHRLLDAPGSVLWIRWSPDGQHLRFTVFDSETVVSSTWEARRDGKRGPVLIKLGGLMNTCCGIWTRDGEHFLFRELRDERNYYWIAGEKWLPFQSGKPFPLGGGGAEILAATASPLENTLLTVAHESVGNDI